MFEIIRLAYKLKWVGETLATLGLECGIKGCW
jgi:hypothetical protein